MQIHSMWSKVRQRINDSNSICFMTQLHERKDTKEKEEKNAKNWSSWVMAVRHDSKPVLKSEITRWNVENITKSTARMQQIKTTKTHTYCTRTVTESETDDGKTGQSSVKQTLNYSPPLLWVSSDTGEALCSHLGFYYWTMTWHITDDQG